jgi:hypothetical protein
MVIRRVERELAPKISAARRANNRAGKRKRRKDRTGTGPGHDDVGDQRPREATSAAPAPSATATAAATQRKGKSVEFAAAPRLSLHDIAMEPPSLQKKVRGAGIAGGSVLAKSSGEEKVPAHRLPVSLAQKESLERERQRAIVRYRELKERKLSERRRDPAAPSPL